MKARARHLPIDPGVTPTTTQRAAALAAAKEPQYWWFVTSEVELAALMHGEVSPAVRAQAANFLHRVNG
jgi:hypothetical protein